MAPELRLIGRITVHATAGFVGRHESRFGFFLTGEFARSTKPILGRQASGQPCVGTRILVEGRSA